MWRVEELDRNFFPVEQTEEKLGSTKEEEAVERSVVCGSSCKSTSVVANVTFPFEAAPTTTKKTMTSTIAWCVTAAALTTVWSVRRSRRPPAQQKPAKEEDKTVFLGGACNPTTWRKDLLIPFLEELGVSYYNPQIDEWHAELIAIEREAKEKAKIHFFVVNNKTRGLASMIEVAELVSRAFFQKRDTHVVVMIDDVPPETHNIGGEDLTPAAIKDLNRARMYLREIVHLHGGRLHRDIESAMADLKSLCQELGLVKS